MTDKGRITDFGADGICQSEAVFQDADETGKAWQLGECRNVQGFQQFEGTLAFAVGIGAIAGRMLHEPPRELAAIDADLKACTDRILEMIAGLSA